MGNPVFYMPRYSVRLGSSLCLSNLKLYSNTVAYVHAYSFF